MCHVYPAAVTGPRHGGINHACWSGHSWAGLGHAANQCKASPRPAAARPRPPHILITIMPRHTRVSITITLVPGNTCQCCRRHDASPRGRVSPPHRNRKPALAPLHQRPRPRTWRRRDTWQQPGPVRQHVAPWPQRAGPTRGG